MWGWDQGRSAYFSMEKIREIAGGLINCDGADLSAGADPLRTSLESSTGLPFLPQDPRYPVWRNYGRIFKALGLASKIDGKLICTRLCYNLLDTDSNFITYDEYLHHLSKIFYYPSPARKDYDPTSTQSFPFCIILKRLFSKLFTTDDPYVDIEEVFGYLIGNELTGLEPFSVYSALTDSRLRPINDQGRQLREMLIFISQLSYLSWGDSRLSIDRSALANLSEDELFKLASPEINSRHENPDIEVHNLGSLSFEALIDLKEPISVDDVTFTEGKKVRVSHLRTERNRKVVEFYFKNSAEPSKCDICEVDVKNRYPWMENLIEVHHILPLASPLHVSKEGTSINDLVGLCPNCHRATHAFYRKYLSDQNVSDFESEEQAREVYKAVKSEFKSI